MLTVQQAFALALQHHQAGRLAEAEALYRQILAVQPNHAEAHSNLGEACRILRRLDEAEASQKQALQLEPGFAEAWLNLGTVLADRGEYAASIAAYRRALELKPMLVTAYFNLGNALRDSGELEESVTAYRSFLTTYPNDPEANNNLAAVLDAQGKTDEAAESYRRALQLKPDYAVAFNNWGYLLFDQGQVDEAIRLFRHAVELKPEYVWMHSTLVYALHFQPGQEASQIVAEQQRWNRKFNEPLRRFRLAHANIRNPERRLRIGYVSPEFRDHVTGRYLFPLFKQHFHGNFEIICYSGVRKPDHVTEAFQEQADLWRNVADINDDALARAIRQDGIDILVDLTQHLSGNRLPVFGRKPAPVQVSFAGYPESTGIDTIDYRISDWNAECGISGTEALTEIEWKVNPEWPHERVYLIDSFWCYDPCGMEVATNELPAMENEFITFGSLNNFCKINDPLLKLWARLLSRVPKSRLVMRSKTGNHRQRTLQLFDRDGIAAERIKFVESLPRKEYLELFRSLDIALDTFPYNGHTTSLDALWMGVPVISLAGQTRVSRGGLSVLSNLGLPELVAHSEDEYVEIAARLAGDFPRLAELRRTLRARMEASVLMDAPHFARQIEQAYRAMWRQWCAGTVT